MVLPAGRRRATQRASSVLVIRTNPVDTLLFFISFCRPFRLHDTLLKKEPVTLLANIHIKNGDFCISKTRVSEMIPMSK